MKQITLKFIGTSPLLLSCDRLADPLHKDTISHKKISTKKTKTEDDHYFLARSQWQGSLYWEEEIGVYVPSHNFRAAIIRGATKNRLGPKVKEATIMIDDHIPLDYGKKLTIDQLWDQNYIDRRTVVVNGKRVMAYRPKFNSWSLTGTLTYDESVINEIDIIQSAENAGNLTGIGGYRPEKGGTFGRFRAEKLS